MTVGRLVYSLGLASLLFHSIIATQCIEVLWEGVAVWYNETSLLELISRVWLQDTYNKEPIM